MSLPLLSKDLIELAHKRSLYWARSIYAAALFGTGLYILARTNALTGNSLGLNSGARIFDQLVQIQAAAIYLFMPAMTAPVLSGEKERDTLMLLLISTLTPWQILWQKLLSRVIPMLCYVVLSFPLLAVAFSYGGVTTADMLASMLQLIMMVFYVAAVGLMCSAYCRTAVESFLMSYLLLGVSLFCCMFSGHSALLGVEQNLPQESIPAQLVWQMIMIGCALGMARIWLVERAFVPARNWMLEMFQSADTFFNEMNQVTGGIVVIKDGSPWPEREPIRWRETAKKSLGTWRYLFRVLVLLEVPIIVSAQLIDLNMVNNDSVLTYLLYFLWVLSLSMICIHSGSVIAGERTRQTLESLLTVPQDGREIIRQKMSGVRRLINVLLAPFVTAYLLHHWLRDYRWDFRYVLLSSAATWVWLWTAAWFAFWIGLKTRSQIRAVITSMVTVGLVLGLPLLVQSLLNWSPDARTIGSYLGAFSPAASVLALERWYNLGSYGQSLWTALVGCSLVFYGCAMFAIREYCLLHADRLLGRVGYEDLKRMSAETLSGESAEVSANPAR